jgi:Repeat of unknown function (DUF5648)
LREGVSVDELTKRNIWRRLRAISFAAVMPFAMCAGAFAADKPLPSCTVIGEQLSNVASGDLVFVLVDSHGNFYQIADQFFQATPLSYFEVPVWRYGNVGIFLRYYHYYQTKGLEEKVCAVGKKIAFTNYVPSAYGAQYQGVRPKPYIVVREVSTLSRDPNPYSDRPRTRYDIYFLSAIGEASDFVLNGGAGCCWGTTSNGFRLPRTGSDLVAVYRFYGSNDGIASSHFYTADSSERAAMQQAIANGAKYVDEGVVFFAPKATRNGASICASSETVPVMRMHSSPATPGDPMRYRYVTDLDLTQSMQSTGWINQGASFCALPE